MSKSSQRKGRGGEREARDILNAAGFSARLHGQWESLDISCDFGDGREIPGEVKRKKDGMTPAYTAFDNGAQFYMHRSDRKEWLITFPLDEFIRRYGPELQLFDVVGADRAAEALCNDLGLDPDSIPVIAMHFLSFKSTPLPTPDRKAEAA